MEILLYFLAGVVLASIGAYFVLRSVKSSAANALTKALEDAARAAEVEKNAAVAALKSDLKNADENLRNAKGDLQKAEEDAKKSIDAAKKEAEERYKEQLQEYKDAQSKANDNLEKMHTQALETLKAQLKDETSKMLKERQNEFAETSKEKISTLLGPL